jgi:adenylate cyclase class 1
MRCHSPSRAAAIAARVDELFTDLDRCFRDAAAARYVLQIGGRLHLLQHCQGSVESASADSAEELLELLATAPAEWSPLVIDRHALEGTPLPAIAPLLAPGQVAVFCEHRREGTLVLVADESSALFHMLVPGLREQSALAALAQFLAAVRYRQDSAGEACAPPVAARFYRLEHAAGGNACSVHPLREPGAASSAQLQVQALAEPGEDDDVSFSVYCDGVAFSERALGAAFGRHIAQHIRTCRPSGDDYPVYITDLDLSALKSGTAGRLRTVHYLQHRYRLERTINAALRG